MDKPNVMPSIANRLKHERPRLKPKRWNATKACSALVESSSTWRHDRTHQRWCFSNDRPSRAYPTGVERVPLGSSNTAAHGDLALALRRCDTVPIRDDCWGPPARLPGVARTNVTAMLLSWAFATAALGLRHATMAGASRYFMPPSRVLLTMAIALTSGIVTVGLMTLFAQGDAGIFGSAVRLPMVGRQRPWHELGWDSWFDLLGNNSDIISAGLPTVSLSHRCFLLIGVMIGENLDAAYRTIDSVCDNSQYDRALAPHESHYGGPNRSLACYFFRSVAA